MSDTLDFSQTVLLFSDGACSGNPGPGGFGTIIVTPSGQVEEWGGSDPRTTNNRMEMTAVIYGLQKLTLLPKQKLWVLTDSTYLIRGITQWIWGWRKNNWRTSEGNEVTNKDLWEKLLTITQNLSKNNPMEWKYIRGHQGIPGNERCDEIAVSFATHKSVNLYKGPLLQYPLAIHDLPQDFSLPALKSSSTEKKKAYSYLSYVDGILTRHSTWSECEARIKGRSNARFKKALSQEDENKIIQSWGLDPQLLKRK